MGYPSRKLAVLALGGLAAVLSAAVAGANPPGPTRAKGRRVESPPIAVRSVEFRTETDPVWHAPAHGSRQTVTVNVRCRNTGRAPVHLLLMDTWSIALTNAAGVVLPMSGARDATGGEPFSPPIAPGQEYVHPFPCHLEWHGGALRLTGSDGFGGVWFVDGLRSGSYRLQVSYSNHSPTAFLPTRYTDTGKRGRVWLGEVSTPPISVAID